MINLKTGLPGSGKTLTMVKQIIDELVYTDRYVVTTIEELKWGRLNEYLQQKWPDQVIDLDARLRIIPKLETFYFYRYRSGGLVLPKMERIKGESREEFLHRMVTYFDPMKAREEYMVPVSYFLDEAHEYFNAREWDEVGRPTLYYISKHRHLHDEVVLGTQAPEMLEATFKRLIANTYRIYNQYNMSWGMFQKRGCFKTKAYYGVPTPSQEAYEVTTAQLDVEGVASCYHTTGAMGIMNRGPEKKGHKKKKLPFWMLPAGAVCAFLAVMTLVHYLPMGISALMFGLTNKATHAAASAGGIPVNAVAKTTPGAPILEQKRSEVKSAIVPVSTETQTQTGDRGSTPVIAKPTVRGYVSRGDKVNVVLSDGRTLTEADSVYRLNRKVWQVDGNLTYQAEQYKPAAARVEPQRQVAEKPEPQLVEQAAESESPASWKTDKYGVSRIVNPDTLATLGKTSAR